MADVDVVIIGAGPAGLSAAMALKQHGFDRLMVIEREQRAGGVPRHCGHPPFGWREYRRILTGPAYAHRLSEQASAMGVEIRTRATVTRLDRQARIDITTPEGSETFTARRAILATGARETPRSARLVGGMRSLGVTTTGALQAMVYLQQRIPFRRPVIVGTELVSLSAVLTCRGAGIRPVAMIEEAERPTAWRPLTAYPRLIGVPVHYGCRIEAIEGDERVEAVRLAGPDGERTVACDGVLFTGRFTPEMALVRNSHIEHDAGASGPVIDQYGRCSDPAYYAAGNLLRPIETAGWSWREGYDVAGFVSDDLAGRRPEAEGELILAVKPPLKFVVPQRLALPIDGNGFSHLQLRVARPATGALEVSSEDRAIWRRRVRALPERRLLIPIRELAADVRPGRLTIELREGGGAA